MSKLEWGKSGSRHFETGIDRGVLYPPVGPGVPWIGLTGLEEDFGGDSSEALYFDGVKIRDVDSIGDFGGTLSAFTYPDQFESLRGALTIAPGVRADDQKPAQFDLSYRTKLGNDTLGEDFGYRIHLIYNAMVVPSPRSRETISDEMTISELEWELSAVPEHVDGFRPTAHVILDATRVTGSTLMQIQDVLYGTAESAPRMLSIEEFVSLAVAYRTPYPNLYPANY